MPGERAGLDRALGTNPFDGDFGDGEVMLSDKIVRYHKDHPCHFSNGGRCSGVCRAGKRGRVLVERLRDGKLAEYRWCETCTSEMAGGDHGE